MIMNIFHYCYYLATCTAVEDSSGVGVINVHVCFWAQVHVYRESRIFLYPFNFYVQSKYPKLTVMKNINTCMCNFY